MPRILIEPSAEELSRAVNHLNTKTAVLNEQTDGQWISVGKTIIYQRRSAENAETLLQEFKKALTGLDIEIVPAMWVAGFNPVKSINVSFSNPLEIKAMANNKFKLPEISHAERIQIAERLTENTGLEWIVKGNEITHTRVISAESYQKGIDLFSANLQGIASVFQPEISAGGRWQQAGQTKVTASYKDPLVLEALSKSDMPKISQSEKDKLDSRLKVDTSQQDLITAYQKDKTALSDLKKQIVTTNWTVGVFGGVTIDGKKYPQGIADILTAINTAEKDVFNTLSATVEQRSQKLTSLKATVTSKLEEALDRKDHGRWNERAQTTANFYKDTLQKFKSEEKAKQSSEDLEPDKPSKQF